MGKEIVKQNTGSYDVENF